MRRGGEDRDQKLQRLLGSSIVFEGIAFLE